MAYNMVLRTGRDQGHFSVLILITARLQQMLPLGHLLVLLLSPLDVIDLKAR